MTTGDAGKGLQRYEATYENIEKDDDGDFVLYADYMELFVERNSLKQQLSDLQHECVDSDDDIRAEAKKVLPPESVDGDSHGVPGITEIVCMLVKQTADLQQRIEELEGELEAEKSNDHWLGEDA